MLAGMTLYGPSRPRAVALQRVLYACALLSGGRFVPGTRPEAWSAPMAADAWQQLVGEWRALVGTAIDGVAVHRRAQSERSGFTVFVCAGRRSIVVRMSTSASSIDLEQRVARSVAERGVETFSVPRPRGSGEIDRWFWGASDAIANRPHRPVRHLPERLTAEIAGVAESVRPRDPDVPSHWVAAHRDLSPWNLRRASGKRWLIDWEDCGWAPPEADEVYFAATRAAVAERARLPLRWTDSQREAVAYWLDRIGQREAAPIEARLHDRTLAALGEPRAVA